MSRRLLDTDVLSEIIKGKNAAIVARAAAYAAQHGRFTISAVSVAEVVYGFRRMGREERIAQFEASLGGRPRFCRWTTQPRASQVGSTPI